MPYPNIFIGKHQCQNLITRPSTVSGRQCPCVTVSQSHAAAGAVRHLPSDPASAETKVGLGVSESILWIGETLR